MEFKNKHRQQQTNTTKQTHTQDDKQTGLNENKINVKLMSKKRNKTRKSRKQ